MCLGQKFCHFVLHLYGMDLGVDYGLFSDDVDVVEAKSLCFGIRHASEASLPRWWWTQIRCRLFSLLVANVIHVLSFFGLFQKLKR